MDHTLGSSWGTVLWRTANAFWAVLACLAACAFLPINVHAQSNNYTVDVCPDAPWRDIVFLRGPSSPETFSNVTKWGQEEVKTYVTKMVLPQSQANLVFIAMALISLLVFLLWRLFRRCCMCCCMRQSCEDRRAQANPDEILRGWGYWLQKAGVWLFAVAAFAILLAGIIMAPKNLFVKMWGPVNHLTDYLDNTTMSMDALVDGLSGVNPILDKVVVLVNNDINLLLIKANLQSISNTLGSSAADPNTVVTALNNLNASMGAVRDQIASVRPQLSASSPTGLPAKLDTLAAGMPALKNAQPACTNYSTRLDALNTQFTFLNAATDASYDATDLDAAMTAVEVETWRGLLAGELATLDTWRSLQTGNTLAGLATSISSLNSTFSDLQYTKAPAAAAALTSFYNAWNVVLGSMKQLLDRIDYVQANVAQLDAATNGVLATLRNVYDNFTALTALQPSPTSLAANLTALAGEVSLGSAAGTLISNLNTAQTSINALPLASLDDARTALASVKTQLDTLSGKYNTTKSAIDAYKATLDQSTFNTMKASAVGSGNTWESSQAAKSSADAAATNLNVLAVQTAANNGLDGQIAPIKSGLAAVDASAASSDAAISSRPSLGPYQSRTASIKGLWDGMPADKTQELKAVNSAIATMEELLVSAPASVRSQVRSIQSSFGSGVRQLESKVITKVEDFQTDNNDTVESVDLARYRATCATLAVAAAVVLFLIVVVAINCPWGIGCAIFFLLLLAALMFAFGFVFSAVLVVAQDGCHHTEHIVLESLGSSSNILPLVNYYFFAENNASVKGVLKSANLVDIDKVQGQVVDLADSMIDDFTAQFNPRPKLQIIITDIRAFINTTIARIDRLLLDTSVAQVRPLYLDFKEFPCCEVTAYSFNLWVVLTFGGWLIFVACTLSMAFLGRLDQLPHSGCCGCKPLIGKRLHNKVHPDTETEDETAVKAVVVAPGQQPAPARAEGAALPPPEAAGYPPPEAAAYPPPYAAYPQQPPGYQPPQQGYPPPYAAYPQPQPGYPAGYAPASNEVNR